MSDPILLRAENAAFARSVKLRLVAEAGRDADVFGKSQPCAVSIWPEQSKNGIDIYYSSRFGAEKGSLAAKRIILSGPDHFGSNRIEMYIRDQPAEVWIRLAEYRLVPPLKNMPDMAISAVEGQRALTARRGPSHRAVRTLFVL